MGYFCSVLSLICFICKMATIPSISFTLLNCQWLRRWTEILPEPGMYLAPHECQVETVALPALIPWPMVAQGCEWLILIIRLSWPSETHRGWPSSPSTIECSGEAFIPPSLFSQGSGKLCPHPSPQPISLVSQSLLLLVTSYLISE